MTLAEEAYVRELLAKRYGVQVLKLPESPVNGVKTYDYDLLAEGKAVAALEIKRFERAPMRPENGWLAGPNGSFSKTSDDNAPATRVGDAIHKKSKQLSTCTTPKVLVFVNDDGGMDFLDFQDAFNGYLIYGDDKVGRYKNIAARKVAEGRIRDEKWTIDLYIWINRYEERYSFRPDGSAPAPHEELGPFIRFASDAGYDLARKFFGVPEVPKPEAAAASLNVGTLKEMLLREALNLPNGRPPRGTRAPLAIPSCLSNPERDVRLCALTAAEARRSPRSRSKLTRDGRVCPRTLGRGQSLPWHADARFEHRAGHAAGATRAARLTQGSFLPCQRPRGTDPPRPRGIDPPPAVRRGSRSCRGRRLAPWARSV